MKTTPSNPFRRIANFQILERRSCGRYTMVFCFLLGAAAVQSAFADNTWDGGGTTGNWSDAGFLNWGGNTTPVATTGLTFGGLLQLNSINDLFTAGTQFNGITFSAGSGQFIIGGNSITLGSAITNSSTSVQTINLNMGVTTVQTVTTTTGGGNLILGGDISGAGGFLTAGAGTLTMKGNNSYLGTTTTSASVTLVAGSNTAFGAGTLNLTNATGALQGDGTAHSLGNNFNMNTNGFTINGSSDLTFNGLMTYVQSGGGIGLNVSNSGLTTFHGGISISNAIGARTSTFAGNGNILIDSAIQNFTGANALQTLIYAGGSTMTLSNGIGSGSVAGSNTAGGIASIQAGTGAAPSTNQGLVSTVKIAGNYTIGSSGAANLIVKGGDASTTNRGVLSLVDGTSNTLTVKSNLAASTVVLTMAGTGLASILNMEVGSTADQIYLGVNGANQRTLINSGGVLVNLTGLGNLNGTTQDLIVSGNAAAFTVGSGQNFALNTTTGNFNGYVVALSAPATSGGVTKLQLTETANATATNAYWKGGVDGNWNGFSGGNTNTSNWTDAAGSTNRFQKPGATTDVFFSASSPSNTSTTLGQDFSIKSLTFDNTASIGGNILTVGNATTGISANTGATGTINSVLAGSAGVAKNGAGAVVLGGNNTFTGGLTINDGIVRVANAGAFNSTTPQTVTFGASAASTTKLQLNGNSITTGELSTNATPGSPIIENANAAAAALTVSQTTNTAYAGVLQDGTGGGALSLTKSGSGSLTLGGGNSYTGTTTISNGTLLVNGSSSSANGAVSVASGATLGGIGTLGGATTISSGGRLTGGEIGTIGTLTFSNAGGLALNSGSISYFDINNGSTYDSILLTGGGGLMLSSGAIIRVSGGLTTATSYNLFTYTGAAPSLSGVTFQNTSGNALASNYSFTSSGGVLSLTISSASQASPGVNIVLSTTSRLMQGTAIGVSGVVNNGGPVALNGTLSDGGGNLTIGGFTPASPFTVAASGGTQVYTGSTNSGATLGNRTLGVTVSDPAASPTAVTASTSVSVLQDRVVSASEVTSFGSVHQGAAVSGTTSLTSAGADDSNTRVTVANATADANGIAVTGGTGPVFNGSTSDTRNVSGNLGTLGVINVAINLTTTGEAGISGTQTPVNVVVNYSASVYSGKAAWTAGASGNWVAGGNWADTLGGGVAGSPGVDGALSAGDTATFGNVTGSPASLTVSLNGTNPSLNGITFNSTSTAYTIAPGSGGAITLQGAATPLDVSTAFSPTISAGLVGSGVNKTGSGTLILAGTNSYTGSTAILNGAIQLTGGNDRLPITTALILGSGIDSGRLILGDATTARNQTVAGLSTSGTGTANSLVGAAAANSNLTINIATGSNAYAGTLGGAGTNENNLSIAKSGAGTLVLTGSNTFMGGTTLSGGSLNVGSANAIGTNGNITFNGGSLQYSAANTTDYSSRFATTGNNAYNLDTNGQNVTIGNALAASGTSGLTKNGAGTLTLSAGNAYTGATTIGAGLLVTADAGTNTIKLAGGVWQPVLTGNTTITGTLGTSTGAGALNSWTAGGFAAIGGKLTVTVTGGDLTWGTGGFMGTGITPMVFGSATTNNQVEVTNNINLNTTDAFQRVIVVNTGTGGDSALLSGILSGGAAQASATGIVKQGNGTLILSGNNTYTGLTTINAGTVIAGQSSLSGSSGAFGTGTGPSNLPTSPSAILLDATTGASPALLTGGAFEVGRAVTINNIATTGTYSIGGSTDNSSTFSGLITTSQNLKVTQVATTGGNALNITGGIAAGANSSAVNFNNAGAVNVSNTAISGNLSVIQSGAGATTFSAANIYTGTTSITGGTLVINGNQSSATGAVAVASGATLKGTGTIGGATTIQSGGIHAPGNSPGIEKFTSDLTYADGSIFAWDIDRTQTGRGTAYDAVNVTGALAGMDGADAGSTFDAVFRIVIGESDFSNAFWSANNHTWTDIFTGTDGTAAKTNWTDIFGGGFQYYNSNGSVLSSAPTTGSFSLSGNTLSWNYSAVPEVSNLLAGALLAPGLLRRKRSAL